MVSRAAAIDSGLGAVSGFEELDGSTGGVGGDDLVALAGVVFEQRQLRAGVRVSRRMMIRMSGGQPARRSPLWL
jgi:hypothetical protein